MLYLLMGLYCFKYWIYYGVLGVYWFSKCGFWACNVIFGKRFFSAVFQMLPKSEKNANN